MIVNWTLINGYLLLSRNQNVQLIFYVPYFDTLAIHKDKNSEMCCDQQRTDQ